MSSFDNYFPRQATTSATLQIRAMRHGSEHDDDGQSAVDGWSDPQAVAPLCTAAALALPPDANKNPKQSNYFDKTRSYLHLKQSLNPKSIIYKPRLRQEWTQPILDERLTQQINILNECYQIVRSIRKDITNLWDGLHTQEYFNQLYDCMYQLKIGSLAPNTKMELTRLFFLTLTGVKNSLNLQKKREYALTHPVLTDLVNWILKETHTVARKWFAPLLYDQRQPPFLIMDTQAKEDCLTTFMINQTFMDTAGFQQQRSNVLKLSLKLPLLACFMGGRELALHCIVYENKPSLQYAKDHANELLRWHALGQKLRASFLKVLDKHDGASHMPGPYHNVDWTQTDLDALWTYKSQLQLPASVSRMAAWNQVCNESRQRWEQTLAASIQKNRNDWQGWRQHSPTALRLQLALRHEEDFTINQDSLFAQVCLSPFGQSQPSFPHNLPLDNHVRQQAFLALKLTAEKNANFIDQTKILLKDIRYLNISPCIHPQKLIVNYAMGLLGELPLFVLYSSADEKALLAHFFKGGLALRKHLREIFKQQPWYAMVDQIRQEKTHWMTLALCHNPFLQQDNAAQIFFNPRYGMREPSSAMPLPFFYYVCGMMQYAILFEELPTAAEYCPLDDEVLMQWGGLGAQWCERTRATLLAAMSLDSCQIKI